MRIVIEYNVKCLGQRHMKCNWGETLQTDDNCKEVPKNAVDRGRENQTGRKRDDGSGKPNFYKIRIEKNCRG